MGAPLLDSSPLYKGRGRGRERQCMWPTLEGKLLASKRQGGPLGLSLRSSRSSLDDDDKNLTPSLDDASSSEKIPSTRSSMEVLYEAIEEARVSGAYNF